MLLKIYQILCLIFVLCKEHVEIYTDIHIFHTITYNFKKYFSCVQAKAPGKAAIATVDSGYM